MRINLCSTGWKKKVRSLGTVALSLILAFAIGIVSYADATQTASQKATLIKVRSLAKEGKILNSTFPVKKTTIDQVEKVLGKADSADYIGEAKGTYYVYMSHGLVFGANKGDQVFELRSFDNQLSKISSDTVKKVLGKPDHTVKSDTQLILGYYAGKDHRLEFVYKRADEKHPLLFDHYNVLYPNGTINQMADDPGRKW